MIGRLSCEEIEKVLSQNILGRLACSDDERPYIVPINYVYDGKSIIAHAVEGMKIRMMRKNRKVCFAVDEIDDLKNWRSVVIWGVYQELADERERYQAIKAFVDRMMYMKISETAIPPETSEFRTHPRSAGHIKPVIYRIIITEKTGRYEID